MVSQGIYSIILLIFSNVFMTFCMVWAFKDETGIQLVCGTSIDWRDCF